MLKSKLRVATLSQLISIIIGVLRATIIPLYLGLTEFGYWQIYLLYFGLLGILSLGYIDGIYLNYGGAVERELPFRQLRSAGIVYFFVLLSFIFLLYFCIVQAVGDEFKKEVLLYLLPNIILVGISSYYLVIFQITNQIHKYSKYLVIDKLIFILVLPLLILTGQLNVQYLMLLDMLSRFLLVFLLVYKYKYFIVGPLGSVKTGLVFFTRNISDGSKLLFANMAGMILLVLGRLYAESHFSIEEFSTYAFGISVTNLLLMAVNSVSVVVYPAMKRVDESDYNRLFLDLSLITNVIVLLGVLLYFPTYFFIKTYFEHYVGVLPYLNLLFVICVMQCKLQTVINTFYKVLRKEKRLLFANLETIFVALIFIYLSGIIFNTIYFLILSLVLAMGYRLFSSELYLCKLLNVKKVYVFLEIVLLLLFVLISEFFLNSISILLYLSLTIFITVTQFNKIYAMVKNVRS